MIFADRADAGRKLAAELAAFADADTRVLALPRGGVPVGFEVARVLDVPLDLFIVRKLGVPGREELAMGAIASGGVRVLNEETIRLLGVDEAAVESITKRELRELERREEAYRAGLPAQELAGSTAILVDDGLATGASMYAAILALRKRGPRRIVVAVPVAPADTCAALSRYVDHLVCVSAPEPFKGVGAWYADFHQVDDEEVRQLLQAAAQRIGRPHDRA